MIRALKKLAAAYALSWLFLLWSALCVSIGAAWMYLVIVAALPPQVRETLL